MKKIILTLTTLVSLFTACERHEQIGPAGVTSTGNGTDVRSPDPTIEELLAYEDNTAANSFVTQQLTLGYGLLEALKNDETMTEIIDYATQSPTSAIDFDAYIATSDVCLSDINDALHIKYPNAGKDFDFYADLKSKMEYGDEAYIPTLNIPNASSAELGGGFFLAIGQEVNLDGDTYNNNIPAWHVSAEGEVTLVLITEEMASTETAPVIIISELQAATHENGNTEDGIPVVYRNGSPVPTPAAAVIPNLTHYTASINYRYDQDNRSEYYVGSYFSPGILTSGATAYSYAPPIGNDIRDCGSIHKNNLYQVQGLTQGTTANPQNSDWFHFISYEHDWYTNWKIVTDSYGIKFRMDGKFSNEWYQLVSNQNVSGGWPYVGFNRYYYTKGTHRVMRDAD